MLLWPRYFGRYYAEPLERDNYRPRTCTWRRCGVYGVLMVSLDCPREPHLQPEDLLWRGLPRAATNGPILVSREPLIRLSSRRKGRPKQAPNSGRVESQTDPGDPTGGNPKVCHSRMTPSSTEH